ncbi:hypothetical protein MKW94_011284 [Papaver nudicaule]|uniref:Uncharacterized protein n=1 Tax=Papaver nudicaule TaxID=74823 RepID=A0AA42AV23_PAPNU|nr:hypothetical protein [Papaver nudicaule]
MSTRRSTGGGCLKCCLVIFAIASALYVSAPALYWRFKNLTSSNQNSISPSSCSPCVCDCPPPLSLIEIAPENLIITLRIYRN